MNKIQQFFEEEYNRISSFQNIFDTDHVYIHTDQEKHWNKIIQQELILFLKEKEIILSLDSDLKTLHDTIDKKYTIFETVSFDEKGVNNNCRPVIEDIMFDFATSPGIKKIYNDFMEWLYLDIIKEDFYFQKTPTIRVRMPGEQDHPHHNVLPTWHSDSFFGHNPREINIWFGITDNIDSGFWVMSLEDSARWFEEHNYDRERWREICISSDKDFNTRGFSLEKTYKAEDMYDKILLFDSRCIHTGTHRKQPNLTTKFSMDVRIILVEDYKWAVIDNEPVFKGIGHRKAEFRPGAPYGYDGRSIKNLLREKK